MAYLKDSRGNIIGRLDETSNGDVNAYNSKGEYLGRYNKTNNNTIDKRGNQISRGDQTQRLIPFK